MKKIVTILVLISLSLSACSTIAMQPEAGAEATPTPLPVVEKDNTIVAEGHFVPNRSAHLSFATNGPVAEVLVEEGDQVKTGDVLARLGNREQLEGVIAEAELELFNAQHALAELYDNLSGAQTDAMEALTAAKKEARDAQKEVTRLADPKPADQSDIDIARANLAVAQQALERAKKKV